MDDRERELRIRCLDWAGGNRREAQRLMDWIDGTEPVLEIGRASRTNFFAACLNAADSREVA